MRCGYEKLPESNMDQPSDEVCEGPDGVEADVLLRVLKGFPEQNQEILAKYSIKIIKVKHFYTLQQLFKLIFRLQWKQSGYNNSELFKSEMKPSNADTNLQIDADVDPYILILCT